MCWLVGLGVLVKGRCGERLVVSDKAVSEQADDFVRRRRQERRVVSHGGCWLTSRGSVGHTFCSTENYLSTSPTFPDLLALLCML